MQDNEIHLLNIELHQLYLTGNPCTSWAFYRQYVVAKIPQLMSLDGTAITKSQRLTALQNLQNLQYGLLDQIQEEKQKKEENPPTQNSYTKESRVKMYEQVAEKKKDAQSNSKKQQIKKQPPSVYNDQGEIRMMNQGKYQFKVDDDIENQIIKFTLKIPRYMDTSQLEVDLNPLYIRVRIKDKYTQIRFPEEIIVEKSKVQRSSVNGALVITSPKLEADQQIKRVELARKKREQEKQEQLLKFKKDKEEKQLLEKKEKEQKQYQEYLELKRKELEEQKQKSKIKVQAKFPNKENSLSEDEEDDDIPDLQ